MHPPIYLDNNATTPLDPRVFRAMEPYFKERFGNAASRTHSYGWQASDAVEQSRQKIAELIGAVQKESVIFTSGTTESNNLALKGLFFSHRKPFHIITQKTEHDCVLKTCQFLASLGCEITCLDVDEFGLVYPEQIKQALKDSTRLVSIMHAHNEIGTVQDIAALAKVAHTHEGVLFHTDAAQTVGKVPVDVEKTGIDLMSFSAHKIYGPKGIGALCVSPRAKQAGLEPLLHGGGHEFNLRSGTLNVPAIAGFACALELCCDEVVEETKRQTGLRDGFITHIRENVDHALLNGHPVRRLANNINFTFRFADSEKLIPAMPGLAVSSGSACASGKMEPSYVIQALGKSQDDAKCSLRFGLGRFTTAQDIAKALQIVVRAVRKVRSGSLEYEMFLKGLKT